MGDDSNNVAIGAEQPKDFEGEVFIVTGAAQGLGRQIASSVAARGATVVVTDLDQAKITATASAIADEFSVPTSGFAFDVSDPDGWADVVRATVERYGRLDHLVNNAGTLHIGAIVDTTPEAFKRVLDVNVTGVFLGMRAALPVLVERGSGSIVNLASLSGKNGQENLAAYCASKAAVISLTQSAAREAAPSVRVNAVCPGLVNTEMQQREYVIIGEMTGKTPAEIEQDWLDGLPLKRFQQPHEIADAVCFLASARANSITGEALNVNGGLLMD